jgi:thiol-disulfide isomerase/thioredoxin
MKTLITMLAILAGSFTTLTCPAQTDIPTLNIGDPAPPLQVKAWLKGDPVPQYEKGKVYVVELWATWCHACKLAMPHLSSLAAQYSGSAVFVGVDIYEDKGTPIGKIKRFVDSMGDRLAYRVAAEDGSLMETRWLKAAEGDHGRGIPRTFVIDTQGRLAWIGHPGQLGTVLPKIVSDTWDIKAARTKRNSDKYLRQLDDSLQFEFARFTTMDGKLKPGYYDSVLSLAHAFVKDEPRLQYAPRVAYKTFEALLHTAPPIALEYGTRLMEQTTYEEECPYYIITDVIETWEGRIEIPAEIYRLGVEAYQDQIDHPLYIEYLNLSKIYHTMADWDRRAGDNEKANDADQKAIEENKKAIATAR